jgi:hypothetical protein
VTTADVLREARTFLDTPEKWKHVGPFGRGQTCAVLAIDDALEGTLHDPDEYYGALADALGVGSVAAVIHWNDAPERTHADVLGLYDRAIAEAERA